MNLFFFALNILFFNLLPRVPVFLHGLVSSTFLCVNLCSFIQNATLQVDHKYFKVQEIKKKEKLTVLKET